MMQKYFFGSSANIMGARKYSTFFLLLAVLVLVAAEDATEQSAETRLPVVKPEISQDDRSATDGKDLLSTLQELYHSLVGQIAVLEARQKSSVTEKDLSETAHLVQHYTAQKDNVEREISLIRSIGSGAAPRHILTHIAPEEKIVPSLLNIFKKPKPSHDMSDFAYSFPYPPYPSYYPGYGPQYPYPYQGVPPPKPDYPYMNTLVQSTFPGHDTGPSNQPTFMVRNQVPAGNQPQEVSPTNPAVPLAPVPQAPVSQAPFPQAPIPQAPVPPAPQVPLQGEVPPAQFEPQRISSPQADSALKPQVVEVAQQALNSMNQQTGQGVFIYYPNAVITEDDEQERPSIVDRVGQAFDRFGQAISNLATRQTLRPTPNEGIVVNRTENGPTRIKVVQNRPRSSPNEKVPTARMLNQKRPKLRWISA